MPTQITPTPLAERGQPECSAKDQGWLCCAAKGHAGDHAAYSHSREVPRHTWPQAGQPRTICLTDCGPAGHLPVCPRYYPSLVKTHPAVIALREALSGYGDLMDTSPLSHGWDDRRASSHGQLAAAAEQARILLDRIAGGEL